jgi:hypothetical protein
MGANKKQRINRLGVDFLWVSDDYCGLNFDTSLSIWVVRPTSLTRTNTENWRN